MSQATMVRDLSGSEAGSAAGRDDEGVENVDNSRVTDLHQRIIHSSKTSFMMGTRAAGWHSSPSL